jgi:FlaA1/EpsC-like NDP-sugar epimerase
MGATKRIAEFIILSLSNSGTRFVAVRFGNVLGSNGSVVPQFKQQILAGGPVTVTHPEMQRFFMTIPEASQLVLQASAMGRGGEVFVLDMGDPVRIVDLARNLIILSGLRPNEDIRIEFTGTRPGEKLYEELCHLEEGTVATPHEKVRVFAADTIRQPDMKACLGALREGCEARDAASVVQALKTAIPDYTPSVHVLARAERSARRVAGAHD